MLLPMRTLKGALALAVLATVPLAMLEGAERNLQIKKTNFQPGDAPAPGDAPPAAAPGELLGEEVQSRRVLEEFLASQVERAINESRAIMGTSPAEARELLKQALQAVVTTPDISGDVRQQLRNQVEAALRQTSEREREVEQQQIRREAEFEEAQRREELVRNLFLEDAKVEAIYQRLEALVAAGDLRGAHTLAKEARAIDPNSPAHAGAIESLHAEYNLGELLAIREMRENGFTATMLTVERSHIPFPDDPPIVYPPADVWRRITESRKKYASVDLSSQGPAESRIRAALDEPTEVEFVETPLQDVVDFLKDRHGIEMQLNTRALDDEGIATDSPISMNLSGISLRSALRLMLDPLGLTYVIKNEVLLVTTKTEAETDLITKVYPVADLVMPIESAGGQGLGLTGALGGGGNSGFGGGQAGFAGGGGQGLGGGGGFGGFGGGGGGFGGGGLGGGGGGFFNMPNQAMPGAANNQGQPKDVSKDLMELIEAVIGPGTWDSQGGEGAVRYHRPTKSLIIRQTSEIHDKINNLNKALRAFSMKEEISEEQLRKVEENPADAVVALLDPAEKPQAKAEAEEPGDKSQDLVKLVQSGADPNIIWEKYFALNIVPQNDVRTAVRALAKKHEYKHVTALIQAAIRHGQVQPWMYEALGLALQAEGRSEDEVERTLMSAVDVQDVSVNGLLYLAKYMVQAGLTDRAMKIYEQAAMLEPTRSEPYLNTLKLCENHFNLDAIQWAAIGLLEQAWSSDNSENWRVARSAAEKAVSILKAAKQFKVADELEKKIFEASKRDVIVVVSWTGEADIDMMVSEPAGTVCSHRNPRTTSGGVLLGDSWTRVGKASTKVVSETYMCPKAFNGEYHVRLRRAWGKPTAGRVNVTLYTNWGDLRGERMKKQITVGDEDRLVVFNLKQGRREDSLEERLVANAIDHQQISIRRDVLLRQLAQTSDSYATKKALATREQAFGRGKLDLRPGARRNPLGFQPVIITLSEGATMSAQAVISADRRYVRFTGVPFFSSIGDVTTYNVGTGQSTREPFGNDAVGIDDVEGGGDGGGGAGGGGGVGGIGGGIVCPLTQVAQPIEPLMPGIFPPSGQNSAHTIIVNCVAVGQIPDGANAVDGLNQACPGMMAMNLPVGFFVSANGLTICNGGMQFNVPQGTIIFISN